MKRNLLAWFWAALLTIDVTAVQLAAAAAKTEEPLREQWQPAEAGVTFDARFPGARMNGVESRGKDEYTVLIRPENRPINDSAWFAFKVSALTSRQITVHLKVEGGVLRYRPKISTDGVNWILLPAEAFERKAESEGTLKLEVSPAPLWVAAQELVSTERMTAWMATLERLPYVTRGEFGQSVRGQRLQKLEIGTGAKNYVVVFGRQHPPETTGSLALMRFIDTVAGDSELARTFRKEFSVLVVPLINPDGVDRGHWRHNVNGVDTNRDWGNFAQPETKSAGDEVIALSKTARLWLHLDFHSTNHDVFYTQPDTEPASPAGFTKGWIEAIQARFPDYKVNRSSTKTPTPTTSHNWAHKAFGIPAITYEIGDETDRPLLQQIATTAAEEMMKRLLALKVAEKK
jgi:predicted deacylase